MAHKLKISAPLVLNPYGVEMLRLCADDQHYTRAVERGEYIWLVLAAKLILQRYAAEEYAVALLHKLIVNILRYRAVLRSLAGCIRFLIAYEYVIRLLAFGNGSPC